jgi:hypothetical protein
VGEAEDEPGTVEPVMADDAAAVVPDGMASDRSADDPARTHRRFSQEI